jgi:hypothetical protein
MIKDFDELGDAGFFRHKTILARIYLFVSMMLDVVTLLILGY